MALSKYVTHSIDIAADQLKSGQVCEVVTGVEEDSERITLRQENDVVILTRKQAGELSDDLKALCVELMNQERA